MEGGELKNDLKKFINELEQIRNYKLVVSEAEETSPENKSRAFAQSVSYAAVIKRLTRILDEH